MYRCCCARSAISKIGSAIDTPPFAMMAYNKEYYEALLNQAGFRKKVDLIAYRFGEDGYDDKSVRIGFIHYNTADEVDRLVQALSDARRPWSGTP